MKQKILAVDFDGPIHPYTKGWNNGLLEEPVHSSTIEKLKYFKEQGYKIVIHTARICSELSTTKLTIQTNRLKDVEDYLKENNVPYDDIAPKIIADAYIDDRAVICDPNDGYSWNGVEEQFRSNRIQQTGE